LSGEVVVAAEDDVRLDADTFEGASDAHRARIGARHRDEAHSGEIGEIDGVVLGERMIRGGDEHLRIADQLHHRVRVVDGGEISERQVGLATADEPLDMGDDGLVAELDVDVGPRPAERVERRREQAIAGRLERADAQDPGIAGCHRVEVGLCGCQSGDDVAGVLEQHLARFGQRHRAWPAGPIDEAMADGLLQRRDLLGDRALRVAEACGRLRERAGLGDSLERHQVDALRRRRVDRIQRLISAFISISLIDR
jgi:hypothetical protein